MGFVKRRHEAPPGFGGPGGLRGRGSGTSGNGHGHVPAAVGVEVQKHDVDVRQTRKRLDGEPPVAPGICETAAVGAPDVPGFVVV